jgi:hypothetical protein
MRCRALTSPDGSATAECAICPPPCAPSYALEPRQRQVNDAGVVTSLLSCPPRHDPARPRHDLDRFLAAAACSGSDCGHPVPTPFPMPDARCPNHPKPLPVASSHLQSRVRRPRLTAPPSISCASVASQLDLTCYLLTFITPRLFPYTAHTPPIPPPPPSGCRRCCRRGHAVTQLSIHLAPRPQSH